MYSVNKTNKTDMSYLRENQFYNFLELIRVRQWVKNIFVFSGLIICENFINKNMIIKSFIGFLLFCGISSSVYILNDIFDVEKDKIHPEKRFRPIASGKIKIKQAYLIFSLLTVVTLACSFIINTMFGSILMLYLILNITYNLKVKHCVILDLMSISLGFVFRSLAGIVLLNQVISIWFLICVYFLTLLLGLTKRKKELILLNQRSEEHRENLKEYSLDLLKQIIPAITSCTLTFYCCFIIFGTSSKAFILTFPIFLYGVLRYEYLINNTELGENMEKMLINDIALSLTVILWGGVYFGIKFAVVYFL